MNPFLFFFLYWVASVSAIPLFPLIGPEYLAALSSHPPLTIHQIPTLGTKIYSKPSIHNKHITSQDSSATHSGFPSGWIDPRLHGGRLLDFTTEKYGEPLNVIISGLSDPFILTEEGFQSYVKSIGFSGECLGLHHGHRHEANLGDGDGRKSQQFLARQHYFPVWGTCWQSLIGGHHFRAWKQNGTLANTGAWFIAASKEMDSSKNHNIVPNGYNIGRDWLVYRAIAGGRWKGMTWRAEVEWREDLLEEGKEGVNHGIDQDGRVAVLTVHRI